MLKYFNNDESPFWVDLIVYVFQAIIFALVFTAVVFFFVLMIF